MIRRESFWSWLLAFAALAMLVVPAPLAPCGTAAHGSDCCCAHEVTAAAMSCCGTPAPEPAEPAPDEPACPCLSQGLPPGPSTVPTEARVDLALPACAQVIAAAPAPAPSVAPLRAPVPRARAPVNVLHCVFLI